MSASSRAPPNEMRTYGRPIARAIDWAIEVLPTPGGPTNSRIEPFDCLSSSLPGASRTTSRDRKSTRLNSSHGYISYAVFCLKKKNYLLRCIRSWRDHLQL